MPASAPPPAPPPQIKIEERARENYINKQEIISRRADPTMVFKHYGVNPTIDTLEENTSTFSIDADTASYSISQSFLDRGQLPDPASIRVEEFINAFTYGYSPPQEDLFALQAEAFPSPYRRGFHVLHLGVKGADLNQIKAKDNNLTFLIDVSGSMAQGQRLEIVKSSLSKLVEQLGRDDTISIVAYSNYATLVLEPTQVRYRRKILTAINKLQPQDSTNIQAGLELAYQIANKSYHPDMNNRIILCSDGVANSGETNPEHMLKRISTAAQRGIYLNAIGVGMGNYNDVILESLAKLGQGQYGYINSYAEAENYFGKTLVTSLQVLARDVRLQIEFDGDAVESYRLLGYENRGMDNSDFNNARKDAGEVGVGHSVTAVYEIKFRPASATSHFGVFRLAYKTPDGEQLNNLERLLPTAIVATTISEASAPAQLSYVAATFAEKLRGSYWSRTYSYRQLEDWAWTLRRETAEPDQVENLLKYIKRADGLDQRKDPYEQRVSIGKMDFDRVPVLQ
jgi:Ca-activated chloride channel family protein